MATSAPLLRAAARAALLGALALTWATGWAQWQWIDNSGRKVFSDTAPPASVPDKNILKRPGAPLPMAAPSDAAVVPATAAASPSGTPAPKVPTVDPELEAKKKQAEAAEEAKKKAEMDRIARQRADNCERARRARATIDAGTRLAVTNAKGERVFLDDQARAAEARRLDGIMRDECGPMPQ